MNRYWILGCPSMAFARFASGAHVIAVTEARKISERGSNYSHI